MMIGLRTGRRLAVAVALFTSAPLAVVPLGASSSSAAASARSPVTFPQCSEQAATGPTATDVNAQAGDGRITVGLNDTGTITVFRYPNPGYYNQVKYFTTGQDAEGHPTGALPNEGSFAGLRYTVGSGRASVTRMVWLKEPDLSRDIGGWTVSQTYTSQDAPVVATSYSSAALGLTVTDTDLATAEPLGDPRVPLGNVSAPASFVRDFVVRRTSSSAVTSVDLVHYEHFDAFGSRFRYFPVEDSCFQQLDDTQSGTYDPTHDAIVQGWQGIDQASGKPSSVSFAFGFDAPSAAPQVGGDGQDPLAPPAAAKDGYTEMETAPYRLSDSNSASGQVTGAMLRPLTFDSGNEAHARMIIAAGSSSSLALAALGLQRARSWNAEVGAVDRYWQGWLAHAPLPAVPVSNPEASRILAVAKRSLITMRLAVDPDTAAIAASADTQGPYGEDWLRDGSFIDEALDEAGYQDLVGRHELFEAAAQTGPTNPDVLRPPGNWPMTTYGDGIPGGPIPYEIDETGFGAWTMWRHAEFLPTAAARSYLQRVFPAIAGAADWITACRDPVDGLQCQANEDDNPSPTQTLHGAGPDLLGLRSAVMAAQTLGVGQSDPRVAQWAVRATSLQQAIDKLWLPGRQVYGEAAGNEGASSPATPNETQLFSDGGWLLWPVELHSSSASSDPIYAGRMASEASATLAAATDSLGNAGSGGYEAKGLLGVCRSLPGLPASAQASARAQLQRAVGMLAASSTTTARGFSTATGLFAESWQVYGSGSSAHVVPLNDAPHVWEHALYYMTALCAFGA